MFESLKNLYAGNLDKCKNSLLFPILRWISAIPENNSICNYCNISFKYVNPEVIKSILYYGTKIKKIVKYPSRTKTNYSFLITDYIKPYFNYSKKDIYLLKAILDNKLKDDKFKIKASRFFGLSEKECKLIDVPYNKLTKSKIEQKRTRSLSDFK